VSTASVSRIELAPGYTISRLIKGGWQLAGGHGTVEHDRALADMHAYVEAGITTFDCADIYTGVESLIGAYLATHGARDVQVHTKCVPDLDRLDHLGAHDLERTLRRSCERLGTAALDLVQFHWWDYAHGDFVAAAQQLARFRDAGLIRHLGATNFGTPELRAMLDAGVPIVAHQVQYSLLDRRPAHAMAALAADHGVSLLCYGALAGGFFHARWLGQPEPIEPLENRSLTKYKLIIDECGGWARFQSLLTLLHDIAQSHHVGIGAVAMRWVLDQPAVGAVIAGARNRAHLADTLAAESLVLSAQDHARLDAHLAEQPVPPGDVYALERDRDGRHGRIMRYNLNTA
jgi:aryl-alcohol dehydrogenase-like predicted oxidoreductase